MAYRHFQFIRNTPSSWGAAAYTKKGVLKRGSAPNDYGTLIPPPDEAGGGNDAFVLVWRDGQWQWAKITYNCVEAVTGVTVSSVSTSSCVCTCNCEGGGGGEGGGGYFVNGNLNMPCDPNDFTPQGNYYFGGDPSMGTCDPDVDENCTWVSNGDECIFVPNNGGGGCTCSVSTTTTSTPTLTKSKVHGFAPSSFGDTCNAGWTYPNTYPAQSEQNA